MTDEIESHGLIHRQLIRRMKLKLGKIIFGYTVKKNKVDTIEK
jgi:hypothetical protein